MTAFFAADAHCDFLYYMRTKNWNIAAPTGRQAVSLPSMRAGNVALQFFAAWIDADLRTSFYRQCTELMDAYDAMLAQHPDILTPLTPAFRPEGGKIACVLSVEGGEALEGDLRNLQTLYTRGVRAMTLTWNHKTELAYPATGRRNKGLTRLGKAAVAEMGRLGIAVDVAHLNDAGIDDVLSLATRPVFASHSNARSVHAHPRSLCDAHIRAIAAQGGLVCINFYPLHLSAGKIASSEDIVRHIDHIAALVGTAHVGIGSDFDGMGTYPKDVKSCADLPVVFERLLRMGYAEADVKRIAYDNLRDYIVRFC